MSKRVRTLLRVSSRQQLHGGDIPVQRAEAGHYIAGRPDWAFDKEYIEKAVSAYKNGVEDRETLQEILADARDKQFDILLTYMSDRIGRQEEYSFYVAALNRLGIEVWTIKDGQLKTEEHVDKLLNYIRFWQNEGESKKTGMRVRDTQKELVRAGKFVGGKAPFGYQLVPSGMVSNHGRLLKKLEIVEDKAEIVRVIYSLAVRQGMGYGRIAKELNVRGVPAVSAGQWKPGTVRSILTNPVYKGYFATGRRGPHGNRVRLDRKEWVYSEKQDEELVIVPPQVWEKAQEIREGRKAKLNASGEGYGKDGQKGEEGCPVPFCTKGRLLLLGLAYCGNCGKRLKNGSYRNRWTTKGGEEKISFAGRYVCPERCGGRSCYSQKYVEQAALMAVEACLGRLKPIDIREEWQERRSLREKKLEREWKAAGRAQAALEQDIAALEEKIPEAIRGEYCFSGEKLASVLREKEQALDRWRVKGEEARKRLSYAMLQMDAMERRLSTSVPDWAEEFRKMELPDKQMLLFALIDKVWVTDGEIRIALKAGRENFLFETDDFANG